MDIQTAKQIRIADFLYSLGHSPVKQQGINLWYSNWTLCCWLLLPCLPTYRKRGINTALAKRECKEARFTHNGKRYFAIASCCYCGDLTTELPIAQSTISQHLKVLKDVGLIDGEIAPPKVCYRINRENLLLAKKLFSELL